MTGKLSKFKRTHRAWRQAHADILDLTPLKERLEARALDLGRRNDRDFAKLSDEDKNLARGWVGTLNKRRPLWRN